MSTRGRLALQRRRLVPAYLLATIIGIVGMHVLMQHCPAPSHAVAASGGTTTAVHHGHAHVEDLGQVPVATLDVVGHTGGSLDDVLMWCAAMLLGAGALLRVLLHRRFSRPTSVRRRPWDAWRPPSLSLSGIGPPPTLAFTVIRC